MAFGSLREAVKVKEFWLLAGSFLYMGISNSGLIGTHFISYCISYGIPVVAAASLLSFMGVFDLVGTTISGWLSDRYDNRWLLFWYYLLRGASLVFYLSHFKKVYYVTSYFLRVLRVRLDCNCSSNN